MKKKSYAENQITQHFESESLYSYESRRGFVHSEDETILSFITATSKSDLTTLEVGGGSGHLLDLIASKTFARHLYNCELVPSKYKLQSS